MSFVALDLDFQDFSSQHQGASFHQTQSPLSSHNRDDQLRSQTLGFDIGTLSSTLNPQSSNFDTQDHEGSSASRRQRGAYGSWGLAYLAQYFDITTEEVVRRIIWSFLPIRKLSNSASSIQPSQENHSNNSVSMNKKYSYVERFIQTKPDLYGPLWICVTLIFTIAFSGNTSTYLDHSNLQYDIKPGDNVSLEEISERMKEEWHYNLYQVNLAASCILSYVFLFPMLLWFFFWFRGCSHNYSLLETICAYGYSLSIFIPISIIMLIQVAIFQYCVVTFGVLLSGYVLVTSFIPVVRSDPSHTIKSSYLILILIGAAHALLAFTVHLRVMKPA